MRQFGVSRTVVREALSRLQASGLVETHHGVGTYALEPSGGDDFRIDPADIATSRDVMVLLELRICLESEAAGLAAARRSPRSSTPCGRRWMPSSRRWTATATPSRPIFSFTC